MQARGPGSGPRGLAGVALAVTGEVLGIFPEIVELQLEVSILHTFPKQWGCHELFLFLFFLSSFYLNSS